MSVIVEFWGGEGAGVKSNRVYFTRVSLNGEDCTKCIVRGISFYDDRLIRNLMCEDRSRGEGRFQGFKGLSSSISEVPRDTLASKTSERNNEVGVVGDESMIEVSEA